LFEQAKTFISHFSLSYLVTATSGNSQKSIKANSSILYKEVTILRKQSPNCLL